MKQDISWFNYDVSFRKEIEIDSEKGMILDWVELKMDLYVTASRTVKHITATPTAFPTSQSQRTGMDL